MVVCAAAALLGKRRAAAGLAAGLAVAVVLQDQARFQPWAWQYFLWFLALSLLPAVEAAAFLRWLTILIYAASGLQKLNAGFVEGAGRFLFGDWGLLLLAAPVFELALALLLAVRRLRLVGLAGSLIMHAAVLLLLAHSGFNGVVWPWNVFMMLSNVLLFLEMGEERELGRRARLALAALALIPAARLLGGDAYPGFALYSSQIENSMILIEEKSSGLLAREIRPFLSEPAQEDGKTWLKLDHNAWSYWALNVPPYPQHRVQTAVAHWICERFPGIEAGVRLVHYSPPGWFDGSMKRRLLDGCVAVERETGSYRLNARAAN